MSASFDLNHSPASSGGVVSPVVGGTAPRISFAEARSPPRTTPGSPTVSTGGLGIRMPSGTDLSGLSEEVLSPARPRMRPSTSSTPRISRPSSTYSDDSQRYSTMSVRTRQALSMRMSPSIDGDLAEFAAPADVLVSTEQLLAEHIYRRAQAHGWFPDAAFGIVAVRSSVGHYVTYPHLEEIDGADILLAGLCSINCAAAILTGTHVVERIIRQLPDDEHTVPMTQDLQVQVIGNLEALVSAKRFQQAAFIRATQSLAMWTDNAKSLLSEIEVMQDAMMNYVWAGPNQKVDVKQVEEGEEAAVPVRPTWHQAPIMGGLSTGLNVFVACLTIRKLLVSYLIDGQPMRLLILVSLPFQFCILQFFLSIVMSIIFQVAGPVSQLQRNTIYYSGIRPERMTGPLPHITIQMPVYKESLEGVIRPTVDSVQAAIKTYELQGGTASIFINDDGMQSLSPAALAERKTYYDENSIAYVARPPHSEHFNRAGRFKKASNMNHALELSIQVEKLMNLRRPAVDAAAGSPALSWDADQEDALYDECLAAALAMSAKEVVIKDYVEDDETLPTGWRARGARKAILERRRSEKEKAPEVPKVLSTWADGNIRMGELILIIDSDTRVPADCFLDGASEFNTSPDLAILQHESGVMKVANHYFENGIAFFAFVVNLSITLVCANGDISPFVGHNAFMRWSALQEIATEEADGRKQIWSECHVSEDFDCALRMLNAGYLVRWATYSKGGFQEGVSLSSEDEVNRWQKYAYGCSEIIFNPIRYWPTRGPFTKQILRFLFINKLPIQYKFSSTAYICSYFALGASLPLSILNFVMVGLYGDELDSAYNSSWNIILALWIVFTASSPVALAIFRFRSGQAGFWEAFRTQFTWIPFFLVFFGGLSYHVSMALISHLVGYNMTWSATEKEVKDTTVFEELPRLLRRFWPMLSIMTVLIAGVGVMTAPFIPFQYQILDPLVQVPLLCVAIPHILYVFILNPHLSRFRF